MTPTYGDPFGGSGTTQTGFGFTGEVTDASGLVYLRARYYVPGLGVFPSLDPVEEGNRYGYVGADVVNRVDPSGMVGERPEQWNNCPAQQSDDCDCLQSSFNEMLACMRRCQDTRSSLPSARCQHLRNYGKTLVVNKQYIFYRHLTGRETLTELIRYAQAVFKYTTSAELSDDVSCAVTGAKGPETIIQATPLGSSGIGFFRFGRGGWNTDYDDKTDNQAFHFWAYVNSSAQGAGGAILSLLGDFVHECIDITDPDGRTLSDARLAFAGVFFGSLLRNGYSPDRVADWVDLWIGNKSFNSFLEEYGLTSAWILTESRLCPLIDRSR